MPNEPADVKNWNPSKQKQDLSKPLQVTGLLTITGVRCEEPAINQNTTAQ